MKKLKILLPVLAIIFAVGLSFAFVNNAIEKDYYGTGYILVQAPNGWATIDVDCNPENDKCIVSFSENPLRQFRVYNSKNLNDPAEGDGVVQIKNGPVPNPD